MPCYRRTRAKCENHYDYANHNKLYSAILNDQHSGRDTNLYG